MTGFYPSATMLELHVPDFEIVKKFYNRLGFETVWERPPERFKGYLVMRWEDNILCFWCGSPDIKNHPYFETFPPQTKPWGLEDFRLKDPNGFYLRITPVHDIMSSEWAVL
jgi:hypothetical protein